jgi:ABC-type nitrate/sulfonate/bicarbonate transport system substrate-binding protein
LCLLAAVVALTGCGGSGPGVGSDGDETLLLGAPPSAVHAGVYFAVERGFDESEGVDLTIRRTGDPAKLLRSGRVQAALLDVGQLGRAPGVVGVMAILQDPYPGLFLCVERSALKDNRAGVQAIIRALQRGYTETMADPESAVQAVLARVGGIDAADFAIELDRISPKFVAGAKGFGVINRRTVAAWTARAGVPARFVYDLVGPVSRD